MVRKIGAIPVVFEFIFDLCYKIPLIKSYFLMEENNIIVAPTCSVPQLHTSSSH